jgi:hypothetical protein
MFSYKKEEIFTGKTQKKFIKNNRKFVKKLSSKDSFILFVI